jgi:site-specific DNA-methyltransferase (adenine-specific)
VLGGNQRRSVLKDLQKKHGKKAAFLTEFETTGEAWEVLDDYYRNGVPFHDCTDMTEEQRRRFVIADNVDFGEWDAGVLANWDSGDLEAWGVDIEIEEKESAREDDYEAPDIEDVQTDIVAGDLFEIGPHRLLCGDSATEADVLKVMEGKKADMVFTDPPYGVAYVGKTKSALKIENDDLDEVQLAELNERWFNGVDKATRDGAYILATVPPGPLHLIFAQDWKRRGWLRQIMVWNKSSMVMGYSEYHYKHEPILFGWKKGERLKSKDRTKTTVWDFDKPSANRDHPTMKPVAMWAYGIGNHTKAGDIIFEPFSGSGTALVASHQLGRICYAIEIDPKYCQVTIDRMLKLDPDLVVLKNRQPYQKTVAKQS